MVQLLDIFDKKVPLLYFIAEKWQILEIQGQILEIQWQCYVAEWSRECGKEGYVGVESYQLEKTEGDPHKYISP